MALNPCPTREQIGAYLSGSITDAEADSLPAHFKACARCQALIEQIEARPDPLVNARKKDLPPAIDDHNEMLRERNPQGAAKSRGNASETVDASFDVNAATVIHPGGGESTNQPPAEERTKPAGRQFGDYELLEEIGRGGMGVVYKARQRRPERIVALKMILAGQLAGKGEERRFHAEADAAAHLEHPHIVPIHEVGEHEGRHYFSMGYVEGSSLAAVVADGPLAPREAAELVQNVVRAVAYAHSRGVIHRDLKPSNILIDQEGQPWISDFGLAKKTETESSLTATGQVLGTPSYMPPEQAAGRIADVGPCSDVYALGAVLYCVLTGRPPFQAASMLETIKQVQEAEPVSPRQLNPEVDRDLETVCLKCLEKDPGRRYATAAELAGDFERYLLGKPIHARPVSSIARLWRWCRRRPLVASLTVALTVALLVGLVGVTWQWRRAEMNYEDMQLARAGELTQLEEVKQQRARAEAKTRELRDVVDEFLTDVSESPELLSGTPGTQALRKRLLSRARNYYEEFARESADDQNLRIDLAAARFRLGYLAELTGENSRALAAYSDAIEILEQLVREKRDDTNSQKTLAASYHNIATISSRIGKPKEALTAAGKELEIRRQLVRDNPNEPMHQIQLARSHGIFGMFFVRMGKPAKAQAAFEKSIEIKQRLVREHPEVVTYELELAGTYADLGTLYLRTGKPTEARALYEKTSEFWERLSREDPNNSRYRMALALRYQASGLIHQNAGKPTDALAAFEKAMATQERLARENPNVPQHRRILAIFYQNVAALHSATGKSAEMDTFYKKALDVQKRLARENPTNPEYQYDLAKIYINIGIVHRDSDSSAEALAAYQKALDILKRLARENPNVTKYQSELAIVYNEIGIVHRESGKPAEALAANRKGLEIREQLVNRNPTDTRFAVRLGGSYCNFGSILSDESNSLEALDWYDRATETLEGVLERAPRDPTARLFLRNSVWSRAILLVKLSRYAEAIPDLERAIEMDTGKERPRYRVHLAYALAHTGDHLRAARIVKLLAPLHKGNGRLLYNAACVYSVASASVAKEGSIDDVERYASKAIATLKRAQTAGYFKQKSHLETLQKDPDLASLRERPDFKKLLKQLQQATETNAKSGGLR